MLVYFVFLSSNQLRHDIAIRHNVPKESVMISGRKQQKATKDTLKDDAQGQGYLHLTVNNSLQEEKLTKIAREMVHVCKHNRNRSSTTKTHPTSSINGSSDCPIFHLRNQILHQINIGTNSIRKHCTTTRKEKLLPFFFKPMLIGLLFVNPIIWNIPAARSDQQLQ